MLRYVDTRKREVFRQIVQDFEAAGYRVYTKLVNSRDYGVPQLRERVFLVGVRNDIDFVYEFPEPTHGEGEGLLPYVTLKDAIGDLENEPGPYFTGSYSTIFMSRNRKKIGINRVLQFKRAVAKHQFIRWVTNGKC